MWSDEPAGTQYVCYVYDNKTTGISVIEKPQAALTIHPNPAQGYFVAETNSNEKQSLQVYNINGKLILTQTVQGKTFVDVSRLADGVYTISFIGSNAVVNKRLVIVK